MGGLLWLFMMIQIFMAFVVGQFVVVVYDGSDFCGFLWLAGLLWLFMMVQIFVAFCGLCDFVWISFGFWLGFGCRIGLWFVCGIGL